MTAISLQAELVQRGYVEITDDPELQAGKRVRHIGDQYPKAYDEGTGTILIVMEKDPSSTPGRRDVEVVVMSERHGEPTPALWADYHTVIVEPLLDESARATSRLRTPTIDDLERSWIRRSEHLDMQAGIDITPDRYAAEFRRAIEAIRQEVREDQIRRDRDIVARLESDSPNGGMVQYAPILDAINAQLKDLTGE